MLAITQQRFGGPEVLHAVEVDRPAPGPGQVLVRVAATSVNAADWKLRSGALRELGDPPFTLGFDVSGVVAELGRGVDRFRLGDAVYGMVFGRFGAYAEYVLVPADWLARKPATLDHPRAAALPAAVLTAWQAAADIVAGQRVLVHAAASGVGHLAVRLLKRRGAYVIGTARAANHEFVRHLGADEVIDYRTVDFSTAVAAVDVVFDLVGGEYGRRSLRVLRTDGRLIDFQGDDAEGDPRYRRFYVTPSGPDLAAVAAMADRGELRAEIAAVLPLDEVVRAHRMSEAGGVRGKIVLVPWHAPAG